MNIGAVRVPGMMLSSEPKTSKLNNRINNLKQAKTLKPIHISEDGVLVDGLMSLIAAYKCGLTEVPYLKSPVYLGVKHTVMFPNTKWAKRISNKKNEDKLVENKSQLPEKKVNRGHKYDSEHYRAIFNKQRGKCYICGREMTLDAKKKNQLELATTDHIIPLALGGSTGAGNTALCCHRCNELKGSLMMSELLRKVIIDQRKFEDSIGYKSVIK